MLKQAMTVPKARFRLPKRKLRTKARLSTTLATRGVRRARRCGCSKSVKKWPSHHFAPPLFCSLRQPACAKSTIVPQLSFVWARRAVVRVCALSEMGLRDVLEQKIERLEALSGDYSAQFRIILPIFSRKLLRTALSPTACACPQGRLWRNGCRWSPGSQREPKKASELHHSSEEGKDGWRSCSARRAPRIRVLVAFHRACRPLCSYAPGDRIAGSGPAAKPVRRSLLCSAGSAQVELGLKAGNDDLLEAASRAVALCSGSARPPGRPQNIPMP